LKKYNVEFAKRKKEAIAKDFAARVQAVAVFGGDDITADVQKVVK